MTKINREQYLMMLILVAVLLYLASAFSLSVSPASALDNPQCEAWAKEIKGRTEDVADDITSFDAVPFSSTRGCKNLCEGGTLRNSNGIKFLRIPAGTLSATITNYLDDMNDPLGDRAFSTGVYGTIAYFCANTAGTDFTGVVVAVQHPDASICGTEFTPICDAPLNPTIPIPVE